MAFQQGHGRKNFVVIKTTAGCYAAFVAGNVTFTDTPEKARLFEDEATANNYYKRSLQRAKSTNRDLPKSWEIIKVRLEEGLDQNR